jgi:hypothetical protein
LAALKTFNASVKKKSSVKEEDNNNIIKFSMSDLMMEEPVKKELP